MTQTSDLTAAVADIHDRLVRLHTLERELLDQITETLRALRRDIGAEE
jgi:phosphomevalonate kinase